jgi:hypothetical protein
LKRGVDTVAGSGGGRGDEAHNSAVEQPAGSHALARGCSPRRSASGHLFRQVTDGVIPEQQGPLYSRSVQAAHGGVCGLIQYEV